MPNIEIPLDLPEVRVLKYEVSGQIIIAVESTREWAICHKCGEKTREFHSYGRQLRLRHMPILGRPVIIEIRPKRFRCPACDGNPTTTQKLEWYDERSQNTKAYDQWLLLHVNDLPLGVPHISSTSNVRVQLAAAFRQKIIKQLRRLHCNALLGSLQQITIFDL